MIPAEQYHLPAVYSGLALVVLVAGLLGRHLLTRHRGQRHRYGPEPDWSVPQLDTTTSGSFFAGWDPRFMVVSLLLFSFVAALLTTTTWTLAALACSLLAVILGRAHGPGLSRRLLALSGFLSMLLIVMPLTVVRQPGDAVLIIDPFTLLPFNLRGLQLALRIALKAFCVAMLMEVMLTTANFAEIIQALGRLGLPSKGCQLLVLAYRYIFILQAEARRMYVAMGARGFRPRVDRATLRAVGNFVGMIFVRGHERTERLYQAMLARGYNGHFPDVRIYSSRTRDWVLTLVWLAIGVFIIVMDLSWQQGGL